MQLKPWQYCQHLTKTYFNHDNNLITIRWMTTDMKKGIIKRGSSDKEEIGTDYHNWGNVCWRIFMYIQTSKKIDCRKISVTAQCYNNAVSVTLCSYENFLTRKFPPITYTIHASKQAVRCTWVQSEIWVRFAWISQVYGQIPYCMDNIWAAVKSMWES